MGCSLLGKRGRILEVTIAISDIHLGSDVCRARELIGFLELLESHLPKTLILNGDVFDSRDFRRLKKSHWKILSMIRKLSDKVEIIWIAGNHDGPSEIVSHLIGVTVTDEYVLESGGKKILFQHGHTFDDFITKRPVLTRLCDFVYRIAQKLDKSHKFCLWLKSQSKTYLRCSDKIKAAAVQDAVKKNCDHASCGHTHKPQCDPNYSNSGCWTELPCHYLVVIDGNVSLKSF